MTVLVLGVVAVALIAVVLLSVLVQATAARGQAQGAADLAALAAAEQAVRGEPDPCATATRVAARNGATVLRCAVSDGAMVQVSVRVPVLLLPGVSDAATAVARAGPVGG